MEQMSESEVHTYGTGVLDSGATKTISSVRTDFSWVEKTPSVAIRTAGGKVEKCGYLGYLEKKKKNIIWPKTWSLLPWFAGE